MSRAIYSNCLVSPVPSGTLKLLLIDKGPEPLIRELAGAVASGNSSSAPLCIQGLHFFVFGGFNKTVDWINAARAQQASA